MKRLNYKPRSIPWIHCILLITLVISQGILPASSAQALSDLPQNTLHGMVTAAGSAVVQGAKVIAWQGTERSSNTTDINGAYSLSLTGGEWHVTVNPGAPSITSPNWVYADNDQVVVYNGNPDPANPEQTLNFEVEPTNATITGSLIPPAGTPPSPTPFGDGNRAWVRARNAEGQGNTVQVDPATGFFSVNILAGNISLVFTLENPLWAPPLTLSGSEWTVAEGETKPAGTFTLLAKQASITGLVTDEIGHTVPNTPVRAWRLDGSEVFSTNTDGSGNYTLHVIQGVWEVRAQPAPSSPFIAAENPHRVTLPTPVSTGVALLKVVNADVTISGFLVDRNGIPISGLRGRIYPTYQKPDGRWFQFGQGAAIVNSQFTLKLSSAVSTNYRLRASFPDTTGYSAISPVPITITPGETRSGVTFPVAVNNSSISGAFLDHDTGLPRLGIAGSVYAASNSGALKRDRINPLTGLYTMDVATTDLRGHGGTFWWLKAFVDPTTGNMIQRPRQQAVFIPYNNGAGADVTANFVVTAMDATIAGQVRDPYGTPVAGARVSVTEQFTPAGLAFHRWTLTNSNGRFLMRLPAGVYLVRADFRNWIAPVPAGISVASGGSAWVSLQFRETDATITGIVKYQGSPHPAFIRAYSTNGGHVTGTAGADGKYTLHVSSGDTWRVQAVSEDGNTFLKSERREILTTPGINVGLDLDLLESETLPDAVIFTFDSAEDQVLLLANGTQLMIPAGALAVSGAVSLVVRPLHELADDGGAQPVALGYRLLAFDEANLLIDHFNAPITVQLPFTAEQLVNLGITPAQLIPSYWDAATNSWKPVDAFSITLNDDGSGTLNLSLNHFTDYATLSNPPGQLIFLPAISK
ncbi:MAG TPA: carboxypeptidase-like regulatory domain-containing protein [Anaerolineaceae bacterium]